MVDGNMEAAASSMGVIYLLIFLALGAFQIATMWVVYTKAGEAGWASLIPIYNILVLIRIAGHPWWYLLLLMIPIVALVPLILVPIGVARRFGKGVAFGLGLLFLPFIFYAVLAFSDAQYTG